MGKSTVIRCRIVQQLNRVKKSVSKISVQDQRFGTGAVFALGQLLRDYQRKRPMVVIPSEETEVRTKVQRALATENFPVIFWDQISQRLAAGNVSAIVEAYARSDCDCLIAVGRGELVDTVKAAAASIGSHGKDIRELAGHRQNSRKIPPVLAIPTCAGSGAESMSFSVLPDGNGNFLYLEGPALMPKAVLAEPEFLANADRRAVADAGMSGLCWAVEGYLACRGSDERTKGQAAEAVARFLANLVNCWNNGGTTEEKMEMLNASTLAGRVASAAGCGYGRALIRSAQAVCGISFAEACSVLLPCVLIRYGGEATDALASLSLFAGVMTDGTREECAMALIKKIQTIAFRMGLPDKLENLNENQVIRIAEMAEKRANPKYVSPVVWTREDLYDIILSVCEKPT